MVDVVPESILGVEEIRERFRPDAMLDTLVSEGVPGWASPRCSSRPRYSGRTTRSAESCV